MLLLAGGMWWIAAAIASGGLIYLSQNAMGPPHLSSILNYPRHVVLVFYSVIWRVPIFIALFGVWRITRPEPGVEPHQMPAARRITRVTALAWLALNVFGMFAQIIRRGPILHHSNRLFLAILGNSAPVLWIVCVWASYLIARHLARRLPSPRLARMTTLAMWGVGPLFIFRLIESVLTQMFSYRVWIPGKGEPGYVSTLRLILSSVGTVLAITGLLAVILTVILAVRFAVLFRKNARPGGSFPSPAAGSAIVRQVG